MSFLVLAVATAATLQAQGRWNDSTALALVERAALRRQASQPDSTLQRYHAVARGLVLFLAQLGDRLEGPPRLVKADQLKVDVYWQAPRLTRQVITAWRDGRWLPTDINYHRDHLGVVSNNFGDRIRIGEGDEVRDVVHPLAPAGRSQYDFRLDDSIRIRTRDREVLVYRLGVRPRDQAVPGVIGTLGIDAASAEVVRFSFSFTAASYLDNTLEDIAVTLENARFEDRYWLPWRQEIEIRRRLSWLDVPARSIIRGRWEIGDYDFGAAMPVSVSEGPAIGGLLQPVDSPRQWERPLAEVVSAEARPVERADLDELRAEVASLAASRGLAALPAARLGVGGVGDVVRVNRVQGLALGAGASFRSGIMMFRPWVGLGTSDERLTARLRVDYGPPRRRLGLELSREIRDLADRPIVSSLVNSLLAQEGGRDLGDYTLRERAGLSLDFQPRGGPRLLARVGFERSHSVAVAASPASGHYRPNPALGAGDIGVADVELSQRVEALDRRSGHSFRARLEGGSGDRDYGRVSAEATVTAPLGGSALAFSLSGGAATSEVPGYRTFAMGGWGTLLGEPFRAWGGRQMILGRAEWRFDLPAPAVPLGPYVSTGKTFTLAPFVAAGWTGRVVPGVPWKPSDSIRPVLGLSVEWLMRLVRVEAGVSLRTGDLGISVDVSREWWGLL